MPDEHVVVLPVGHEHLIQSSEVLVVVLVHNAEHVHAIALDLLDWISVKRDRLQVVESLQLFGVFKAADVVAV